MVIETLSTFSNTNDKSLSNIKSLFSALNVANISSNWMSSFSTNNFKFAPKSLSQGICNPLPIYYKHLQCYFYGKFSDYKSSLYYWGRITTKVHWPKESKSAPTGYLLSNIFYLFFDMKHPYFDLNFFFICYFGEDVWIM